MKIIITGRPYSGVKDVKEAIESDSTLMAKNTIIIKDTVPEAIDCMKQNLGNNVGTIQNIKKRRSDRVA